MVAYCETRPVLRRTYAELKADAGALEAFLRSRGVSKGDRVAGVVTNGYEALVGMLAATSMGAIWSSASPTSVSARSMTALARLSQRPWWW